jgi:hypothetical protein
MKDIFVNQITEKLCNISCIDIYPLNLFPVLFQFHNLHLIMHHHFITIRHEDQNTIFNYHYASYLPVNEKPVCR